MAKKKMTKQDQTNAWLNTLPLNLKTAIALGTFIGFFIADNKADEEFGQLMKFDFGFWRQLNGFSPMEKSKAYLEKARKDCQKMMSEINRRELRSQRRGKKGYNEGF